MVQFNMAGFVANDADKTAVNTIRTLALE